jgi:hypothetical protein
MVRVVPSNRTMLLGTTRTMDADDLRSIIDDGVDAFLRAHSMTRPSGERLSS